MTKSISLAMFVLALCAAIVTPARADESKTDKKFVMEAAQGGMAEVKLSQLAMEKGTNDEVKKFATKMVDEHGKANEQLMTLAKSKNWELPTDIGKHQKAYDKLAKLSGAKFDKEYVEIMVDDHKKTVKAFEKQAEAGDDKDLKDWASKLIPTLQEHLAMIEGIEKMMDK